MRRLGIALVGGAVLLAGCATSSAPRDLGKLQYTGFSTKADGSAYQSVMGLSCPSEIDGLRRVSTKSYNEGGTDVGCGYSSETRAFTVYFSRFPGDSLETNFRGSQSAVQYVFEPQGYAYDEDLSDSCSSQSLDSASILSEFSGILSGDNTSNTITLSSTPSAVYINRAEGDMSLVIVEEMFEKDFFKTRYTGPYTTVEDVEKICKFARDNFLEMKASVGKARGIKMSDSDKLSGLINSAGEGS